MRHGITLLRMPEGLASDRLVLLPDAAFAAQIKIQSRPRGDVFHFNLRRGYRGSPSGCRSYAVDDFDLALLVMLPEQAMKVAFRPGSTLRIPVSEIPQLRADPLVSFWCAVAACGCMRSREPDRGRSPCGTCPLSQRQLSPVRSSLCGCRVARTARSRRRRAATDHPGKIDAALRRPGRFDGRPVLRHPDPVLMPKVIA